MKLLSACLMLIAICSKVSWANYDADESCAPINWQRVVVSEWRNWLPKVKLIYRSGYRNQEMNNSDHGLRAIDESDFEQSIGDAGNRFLKVYRIGINLSWDLSRSPVHFSPDNSAWYFEEMSSKVRKPRRKLRNAMELRGQINSIVAAQKDLQIKKGFCRYLK